MVTQKPIPTVGFILEQTLGHVTHADNLQHLVPNDTRIKAIFRPIPYEVDGWAARVPGYGTNWTVRAGLRTRTIVRQLRRNDHVDALFVHTQVPSTLAGRSLGRVPTVISVDATPMQYDELGPHYNHERGSDRVEKIKWRLNVASFARAAHIVSWSEWAKQSLVDDYDVTASKVSVFPPGVDVARWSRPNEDDASHGSGDSGGSVVRILFVGGDLERKGGSILIEAFRRVRDALATDPSAPAVELHLATNANVAPEAGVVVHRGLKPNSPELIALYHDSHIFSLPTRGDCLPMVLSEAGAAGLPLVSTTIGAIPEIVRDEQTGLLVPTDDVDHLQVALTRLVRDPALRHELGTNARNLVAAQFDAQTNASGIVDVLIESIAARGTAS